MFEQGKRTKDAQQQLPGPWNNLSIACLWSKMHTTPKVRALIHSATADLPSAQLRPETHKIRSQKGQCHRVHVKQSSALRRAGLRLSHH